MIRRRGLPPIFWGLFGLLVVSGFAVSLGTRETDTQPAVANFDSSGTSALYALLQRAGYSVAIDPASKPHLGPHDVAICFRQLNPPQSFTSLTSDEEPEEQFKTSLTKFLTGGGRAVSFLYSGNFADQSHRVLTSGPKTLRNKVVPRTLQVMLESDVEADRNSSIGPLDPETPNPADAADKSTADLNLPSDNVGPVEAAIWLDKDTPVVWATEVGKGRMVVSNCGLPASNRFIDKADDAEFVLSTIDLVAKPGDRLVFTEASFGNISDPGFFESIGQWAVSVWRQLIVLFVVLVFSLGKRFGYPEETRRVLQGSRDLADAFGDLLHRSRAVDVSLDTAHERLDLRLRNYLRIPRDASEGERNRLLPEHVILALTSLRIAGGDKRTKSSEALRLIQRAERIIDEYCFSGTHQRSA